MVIQSSWAFILESEKLPVASVRGNTGNARHESPYSVLPQNNTGLALNQCIGARYFHLFIISFASGCCKTIFILLTSRPAWRSIYFSLATQAVLRKIKLDSVHQHHGENGNKRVESARQTQNGGWYLDSAFQFAWNPVCHLLCECHLRNHFPGNL